MNIWKIRYDEDECPEGLCEQDKIVLDFTPEGEDPITCELRLPETDSIELQLNPELHYTRGLELKYLKDAYPTFRVVHYTFENIRRDKRKEFFDFYKVSAGMEIYLTDYCGYIWKGVILNPEITSTEQAYTVPFPDSTCEEATGAYTLNFDFEGVANGHV